MSLVPIPPTALAIYISGAQCMIGFYVCSFWEGDVPLSRTLGKWLSSISGLHEKFKRVTTSFCHDDYQIVIKIYIFKLVFCWWKYSFFLDENTT